MTPTWTLILAAFGAVRVSTTRSIYVQPLGTLNVSTHVFANPKPWPLRNMTNKTGCVSWQHGDVGGAVLSTPYARNLSHWTGVNAIATQQAVVQPAAGTGVPWTAVQFAPDGTWGAAMNTSGADPVVEHLTTTTLESQWLHPDGTGCVKAFSDGARGFVVALDMAVPFAFHEPRSLPKTPAAIYVSLSVYLRTPPGTPESQSQFIWYETKLFDLERDVLQDHVFIDSSSHKLIISGTVSGHSKYNRASNCSALSRNATFGGDSKLLHFSYEVTAAHVEQGIRDGLARFPSHWANQSLPLSASDYCVPGYNIELEATPGAGAGIQMRGLAIDLLD